MFLGTLKAIRKMSVLKGFVGNHTKILYSFFGIVFGYLLNPFGVSFVSLPAFLEGRFICERKSVKRPVIYAQLFKKILSGYLAPKEF